MNILSSKFIVIGSAFILFASASGALLFMFRLQKETDALPVFPIKTNEAEWERLDSQARRALLNFADNNDEIAISSDDRNLTDTDLRTIIIPGVPRSFMNGKLELTDIAPRSITTVYSPLFTDQFEDSFLIIIKGDLEDGRSPKVSIGGDPLPLTALDGTMFQLSRRFDPQRKVSAKTVFPHLYSRVLSSSPSSSASPVTLLPVPEYHRQYFDINGGWVMSYAAWTNPENQKMAGIERNVR